MTDLIDDPASRPPPPQLGGLTLVSLGVWVSVDGASFLRLLGPFSQQGLQFVNVGFFCAAIGAVLLLLGLLGCCSAHKESRCLLLTVGGWGGVLPSMK